MTLPRKPRPRGSRKFRTHPNTLQGTAEIPAIRNGYVKSFDGTKLFYSIEGKGPPLVFCYGLVCSSLHWTYQIDHFRKNYQTIWFDYRGHQNSDMPEDLNSLTIENLACDLGILLDGLEIEKAAFLGHSLGVNVALELYRQRPKQVSALVLANGTAKRPLETMFGVNVLQRGFQWLKKLHHFSPGIVEKIWKNGESNPLIRMMVSLGGFNAHLTPREDIELYIKQISEMDPSVFLYLVENYDRYDATAWLHTIQAPTLIIAGDQDLTVPPVEQELMHQLIPGSRIEVIKQGSHCPQMDLPELVSMKIERFLKEVGYEGLNQTSSSPTENSNQSIDPHLSLALETDGAMALSTADHDSSLFPRGSQS